MRVKIILCLGLVLIAFVGLLLILNRPKSSLVAPFASKQSQSTRIQPSETLKEYEDPAGFRFGYPDNLSIEKEEIEDTTTYASLQLFSKEVNGSLALKISDSKFTSLDNWLKAYKDPKAAKEVNLGNLKAFEIKTNDRLYLGALDQGIFFTIEVPLIEEDFWMKVYNKVLADFSFVTQETSQVAGVSDVTFEGEEMVE